MMSTDWESHLTKRDVPEEELPELSSIPEEIPAVTVKSVAKESVSPKLKVPEPKMPVKESRSPLMRNMVLLLGVVVVVAGIPALRLARKGKRE